MRNPASLVSQDFFMINIELQSFFHRILYNFADLFTKVKRIASDFQDLHYKS